MHKAVFVVFGGSGDLFKGKVAPALTRLVREGELAEGSVIVGISRKELDDGRYRSLLEEKMDSEQKESLGKLVVRYYRGDGSVEGSLEGLKGILEGYDSSFQRVFYFCVSPLLYRPIAEQLFYYGLVNSEGKLVFEKPFGVSLRNAEELHSFLEERFSDERLFFLDHYLGKVGVQQFLEFRRRQTQFEQLLRTGELKKLVIRVNETTGLDGRLALYDSLGAVRDMFQNHLLQVLSLVLVDSPTVEPEDVSAVKEEGLRSLSVSSEQQVFGQYRGYVDALVALGMPVSRTETFVHAVLQSSQERWKGIPFVLETGKKLDKKRSEMVFEFAKGFMGSTAFTFDLANPRGARDEYAVLFEDVLLGRKEWFVTFEEIKESWRIAEELLAVKEKGEVVRYAEGSGAEEIR